MTLGGCPAGNRSYAVYGPQAYLPPCVEDLSLDDNGVPKNVCPSIAGGVTADVRIFLLAHRSLLSEQSSRTLPRGIPHALWMARKSHR